MYKGKRVAVVVPAYNEEGLVGETLATMPAFVDRVYAVDDASTDGTWAEIRAVAGREGRRGRTGDGGGGEQAADGSGEQAADGGGRADGTDGGQADDGRADGGREGWGDGGPEIVPVRHEENRGVGGAIKTGYRRAHADGIDVVAVMGGDGQMDPGRLHRVVDPVVEDRADYAKGNRLLHPGGRAEMPRFRLFGNVLLSLLTKVASGYWGVSDPQNGYTAISADALDAVDYESMYEFYGYCNDLLVRCNVQGLRVADVPSVNRYGDETSGISLPEYVPRVSWLLLRRFLWRLRTAYVVREFHPLVLLYAVGALAGLFGVGRALRRVRARIRDGEADGESPALALLASALSIALAMVFDREANADASVLERE
jgi:glycosyltransferase involved in cell wall biosynthesis